MPYFDVLRMMKNLQQGVATFLSKVIIIYKFLIECCKGRTFYQILLSYVLFNEFNYMASILKFI